MAVEPVKRSSVALIRVDEIARSSLVSCGRLRFRRFLNLELEFLPVFKAMLTRERVLYIAQHGCAGMVRIRALETLVRFEIVFTQSLEPVFGCSFQVLEMGGRGELSVHGAFLRAQVR